MSAPGFPVDEESDHRHRRLLRARDDRPNGGSANVHRSEDRRYSTRVRLRYFLMMAGGGARLR